MRHFRGKKMRLFSVDKKISIVGGGTQTKMRRFGVRKKAHLLGGKFRNFKKMRQIGPAKTAHLF